MKHAVVLWLRGTLAALLALLIANPGGTPPVEKERPAANTVTAYDEAAADYRLTVNVEEEIHDISDLLFGVFFEDINFAGDGGLYAEMVANRSFEFTTLAAGDQLYGWRTVGDARADVTVGDAAGGLNENNTNYLVLTNAGEAPAGIANVGFLEGMAIEAGKDYQFSLYARALDGYAGGLTVRLTAGDAVAAEGVIPALGGNWQRYDLTLTPAVTAAENVTLQVLLGQGGAALDMISLFPETYKNRPNGVRKDLGELLEGLQPKFLRFPGGCVIEGYDEETAYHWKDSVGTGSDGKPLLFDGGYGNVAARRQGINIWTNLATNDDPWPSFMSYGLGFFEFFQLCEDLGASPVPVLNAGLYCQMRGCTGVPTDTPLFAQYVQDLLDLVEFCRGGAETTWGAVRCSLGHPAPFEIKYIAVGNENEGPVYYERYQAFLDAFKAAAAEDPALYDGIELIYSAGAADATHGGNYIKSYEYAKTQLTGSENATDFAGAIDQHYYNTPDWYRKNADYYDEANYKRTVDEMTDTTYGGAIPVFLGEYAAQSNTLEAALAEAAYMTGLERNGDIVRMACYAPLFSSTTARHWAPNLIWFNNHAAAGSVNYQAQKLFSTNTGTKLLRSSIDGAAVPQPELKGRVGLGTWYTAAEFDNLKITDNATGRLIARDSFTLPTFRWNWENPNEGDFKIRGGKLVHVGTGMNWSNIGDIAYYGADDDMQDYTFTVEATKTEGEEGFLIAFAVQDRDNNFFWNLGGWQNTVSCLQRMENGEKTGQILKTVRPFTAETGKTYRLKVVVSGTCVQCYVDDELYVDYDTGYHAEAEAYQVASRGANGDVILKLVNVTGEKRTFALAFDGGAGTTAQVQQLSGANLTDENILGQPETCRAETFTLDGFSEKCNYTVPPYSVTVLRLPQG